MGALDGPSMRQHRIPGSAYFWMTISATSNQHEGAQRAARGARRTRRRALEMMRLSHCTTRYPHEFPAHAQRPALRARYDAATRLLMTGVRRPRRPDPQPLRKSCCRYRSASTTVILSPRA